MLLSRSISLTADEYMSDLAHDVIHRDLAHDFVCTVYVLVNACAFSSKGAHRPPDHLAGTQKMLREISDIEIIISYFSVSLSCAVHWHPGALE